MGGRGARFGKSNYKNPHEYGTQYETLLEHENIKFVTNRLKGAEPLMETMTAGRIYVQVGRNDLVRIVFMGADNTRNKVIERDKRTGEWHVHHGYEHAEYGEGQYSPLSGEERKFLDKVKRIWDNRH